MLSLRIYAGSARVQKCAPILIIAELRNNSKRPLHVLWPLGDHYSAWTVGLRIRGPRGGEIRYTGADETYLIPRDAFPLIAPGQVVRGRTELPVDCFKWSDEPGEYTISYQYFLEPLHNITARRHGIDNLWQGEITTAPITVTKY